jgi:oligoribonuclease NrnB/cAMP/cGMP phosphodiesterase (DHH superfamily)
MKYAIYHSADLDGITCGALAKIAHPDINLIGYDYGQPLDEIEAIPDGSEVYMMDVSLKKEEMLALAVRTKLTWIDHHKSAINDLFGFWYGGEIEGIYNKNYLDEDGKVNVWCHCSIKRAACELALEFFNPSHFNASASVVELVGKYDTRRKDEEWNNYTLPFQFGLRSFVGLDVDKMIEVLSYGSIQDSVLEAGLTILSYQREQARIIMKNSFECTLAVSGSDYEEEEFECIVVNTMGLNTDMLPPEIDLTGKILLQFILRKDDLWHISMRSEGDLDVGAICTKIGGGGHKNAAGCILTLNEKMERFWEFGSTNDDKPGFLVIDHTIED